MFSLIPSDANDPHGLMRCLEPTKQNKHTILSGMASFTVYPEGQYWHQLLMSLHRAQ